MKNLILTLLLLFSCQIHAQFECSTPTPVPPAWVFDESSIQTRTNDTYSLNLFLHIVRNSSANGLNNSISTSILSLLNSRFQSAGIQFVLIGSEYIDNDYYYNNFDEAKKTLLFGENSHANAIDLYILGTNTYWGNNIGVAQTIPSSALIIHGGYYDKNPLIHEMGHCLGLYHTHHGTIKELGGDVGCAELVDGSNGDICGDYIRDTPADPFKWSGCTYTGNIKDDNGQAYHPDPTNYMCYADPGCWTKFTPLQIQRMKNSIHNDPVLQRVIHFEIAGPDVVCQSANYTVAAPSIAAVSWNLSPSGGAPYPTLQANGNACTVTNTYHAQVSTTLTANLTIRGVTIQVQKKLSTDVTNQKQEGTYQQAACNFYGVTHPALSGNLTGEAIFVHQGCRVTVNLQQMEGKTCTAETNPSLSGTPTFWTYQGNTHQLLFELPYGAGSVPFRFHITGDGMCQPKSLLFFAISDNKSAYSLTAEALPGSNQCTIRIEAGDKQARNIPFYHVSVFDLLRGTKAIDFEMRTDEYTFDTYGWPEGSYVVFARIGTETVSQKIIIKP